MNICIFEDNKTDNFYPLSLSRPVYHLKSGIYSLAEKIKQSFNNINVFYHCRAYLRPVIKKQGVNILTTPKNLKSCLFINGRILADTNIIKKINPKNEALYYFKNTLIAAYLKNENLKLIDLTDVFKLRSNKLKKIQIRVKIAEYIWDLINYNSGEITKDYKNKYQQGLIEGRIYPGVNIINKKNIYIGKNTQIKSGTVLDAEKGPIIIEKDTEVMPNSVIIGPVYIGQNCKIKSGAKIYEGTTIGKVSKVGGEIEESIIHEYSNKQHEGFLGHSYIGSWCNLGADTNNSDLKNNYSSVDVVINGKKVDTDQTFVGLFMGDHSKTGINTMFNTGTMLGFSSNVFGAGYLPKYIPSFSWLDAQKGNQTYKLDKAMEVAKKVMSRRNLKFSNIDKNIFKTIFDLTKEERKI